MLVKLLCCCLFTFISFSLGRLVQRAFRAITKQPANAGFLETVLVGTALLTAAGLWLNLFLPVNYRVTLVALVALLACCGKDFVQQLQQLALLRFRITSLQRVLLFFNLLLLLGFVSFPVLHSDSFLYHLPAVHAAEQYPAVPGIAHINERLAFNKGYFVLQAFFAASNLLPASAIFLNGWLSFLLLAHCIVHYGPRNLLQALAGGIAAFAFFYHYLLTYSSPSTDTLVAVVYLYVLLKCTKPLTGPWDVFVLLLLPVFVFAVKANGLLLLCVPLLVYGRQLWTGAVWKRLTELGIVTVLLVLPCMTHTYIASGYLVYPFFRVTVIQPEYAIPEVIVRLERELIGNFVKNNTYTQHAGLFYWIPGWIRQQIHSPAERLPGLFFLLVVVLAIPVGLQYVQRRKAPLRHMFRLYAACLLLLLVSFLLSPQHRFLNSLVVACFLLSCQLLPLPAGWSRGHRLLWTALPFLLLFGWCANTWWHAINDRYARQFLFVPFPRYTSAEIASAKGRAGTIELRGKKYFFNRDKEVINVPHYFDLEEVYYYLPGLEARGSTFRAGFLNKYVGLYESGYVPDSLKAGALLPESFYK